MGPNISENTEEAIFKDISNPEHPKEAVISTVGSQNDSDHITSVILFCEPLRQSAQEMDSDTSLHHGILDKNPARFRCFMESGGMCSSRRSEVIN
ncbi:unnamed protein product [Leuciscus chuanchicus]